MSSSNSGESATIKFQSMPKRFMIWDTVTRLFCESVKNEEGVFDMEELADFMEFHRSVTHLPMERFVFCQSTNLFDKDGKEISEGNIVDWCDKTWLVFWHEKYAQFNLRNFHGDKAFDYKHLTSLSAKQQPYMKVLGHILSNPELLEEK